MTKCGAPTQQGTACRWDSEKCRHHQGWRDGPRADAGERTSDTTTASAELRPAPDAIEKRDIHGLAWWALRGLTTTELDARTGSVIASLLRVVLAAGEAGLTDDEEARREVELRGLLMHGIPPRNDEEWERLEQSFSPEAVEEVRRWRKLLVADRLDGVDPGLFGDEAAGQPGESSLFD